MYYSKARNKSTSHLHQLNRNFLLEEINRDTLNKECFDCGLPNPDYISINNGIFLCKKCINYHFKFPDEISTLIKNNLNILGEKELKYLYFGGNRRLSNYISEKFADLNKYQPELLYITDELKYYRYKLSSLVNGGDINENKLSLTQKKFYHPMTEKRIKKNYSIDIDNNNYFNNGNNLKMKYNYRKIPLNINNEIIKNKSTVNSTRREYKKRTIPNNDNLFKSSRESYVNSPNKRQNRFENDYLSNDSQYKKKKTFDQKNEYDNNKYEYENNSNKNINTSWLNNTSNEVKYINNYSYKGRNINYKDIMHNAKKISSPRNNNIYYNFRTEDDSPKSPLINNNYKGIGYKSNNRQSKYQSFYHKYNFEIPNKLILPNQTDTTFVTHSNRVYSKPKVPKNKINNHKKKRARLNSQILNDLENNDYYFTIQNIDKNEGVRDKIWLKSHTPRIFGKKNDIHSPYLKKKINTPRRKENSIKKEKDKKNEINTNKSNEESIINKIKELNDKIKNINIISNINNNEMNKNENNKKNNKVYTNGKTRNFKNNENQLINRNLNLEIKDEEFILNNNQIKNIKNLNNKITEEKVSQKINNLHLNNLDEISNTNNIKIEVNNEDSIGNNSNDNRIQNNDIKNKKRRNKKIKKREKEERLKMEIEEKYRLEEKETKKRNKKKFTKKELLKLIKEERLKMEKEDIRSKIEKENEDKVIKEEDEEDEQDDDDPKEQKLTDIEKIEEKLEEYENDNEEEKGEKKINEENEKLIYKEEKNRNIQDKIKKEENNKMDKKEEKKEFIKIEENNESQNKTIEDNISQENEIFDKSKENENKIDKKKQTENKISKSLDNYKNEKILIPIKNKRNEKINNLPQEIEKYKKDIKSNTIEIDWTFKNSIRNKYKRKRQLLNNNN